MSCSAFPFTRSSVPEHSHTVTSELLGTTAERSCCSASVIWIPGHCTLRPGDFAAVTPGAPFSHAVICTLGSMEHTLFGSTWIVNFLDVDCFQSSSRLFVGSSVAGSSAIITSCSAPQPCPQSRPRRSQLATPQLVSARSPLPWWLGLICPGCLPDQGPHRQVVAQQLRDEGCVRGSVAPLPCGTLPSRGV